MLNSRGSVLGLSVGLVVMVGCATSTKSPATTTSSPATTYASATQPASVTWFRSGGIARAQPRGCMMESRYTEGDVTKILRMRDNGESLKTVAAEVGGTRQEVKCAERSAITAKRNARFVQK
jgi:hypothetical protein